MSFAEKILKKSSTPIHYIWGKDESGENCYWFVCCSNAKYRELQDSFGKSSLSIEDFGAIVAQGSGRIPDEVTKQRLISEYKVNWADYADSMQ